MGVAAAQAIRGCRPDPLVCGLAIGARFSSHVLGFRVGSPVIDHLVYAAPDLAAAVADLEARLGVLARPGGKHVGLGTHNALLALGPRTYLEIIAPDPEQPEPAAPRPFGVDGISDIERAVAEARARGYDPGDVTDAQRVGPTGVTLRWRLTLSAMSGGPVPFLISWGDSEHPAASAPHGLTLESFHLEHPDPPSLAGPLAALGADVEVRPASRAAMVAHVNGPTGGVTLT
jgi:hypothetical protein